MVELTLEEGKSLLEKLNTLKNWLIQVDVTKNQKSN